MIMNKPIKNLILDMDGVLWRGDTPMSGLVDFFDALRSADIGFILATNNATKTVMMYTERLARFGVQVLPQQILTSAEATASYLTGRFPPGSAVYVIGAKGLHDAISARGFHILSVADVHLEAKSSAPITAAAVVAGFSPNMTYQDVAMGAHLINQGVPFIGTNPDATYPTEIGPMPGAGATLAMLIAATGVQPTIIGKPGPVIFQEAVERLGGDPSAVAMVGDRLSTDIQGAKAAGLQAILVLSGISTREEAETGPVHPDYIFADITELAAFLMQEQAVAH